jgi:pantoate kinase
LLKKARAFSPAGISSFFEICNRTSDGKPMMDPERIGARGGGFGISKGVLTEVNVTEAHDNQVHVFINGRPSPEAETTRTVVEALLPMTTETCNVTVRHSVEVPIGAGFGSSAAGALGTALALSKALELNLTYNQLGRIAHVAEVRCLTGLGTVGPLMLGGCIITLEPGAPGYASIDRIPLSPDHRIVAGTYRPLLTKEMLSSEAKRQTINEWGRKTLVKIFAEPSLENFLQACKQFAIETGLATSRVQKLIQLAEKAGAIGAAQNMVGEAVHALVTEDTTDDVVQAFESVMASEKIIAAKIDFQGARRLG